MSRKRGSQGSNKSGGKQSSAKQEKAKRKADARSREEQQQAGERLVTALTDKGDKKELWVWLGEFTFIAFLALFGYLGMRPGGYGPVLVYADGQRVLGLVSLLILIWGCVACFRKPPLKRKGRIRALIAVVIVIGLGMNPFPYPSSREFEPSTVEFRVPGAGDWRVYWGGESTETNLYAAWFPDRRWALALMCTEDNGLFYDDSSRQRYSTWGAEVLSPSAGRVVRLVDDEEDRDVYQRVEVNEELGNHLVIEVADGEFLFLCHLKQGSLRVAVGDEVEAGEILALVGYSGHSTVVGEPHLELHLQTTPDAHKGEAIPWKFHNYLADGEFVEKGLPRGQVMGKGTLTGQLIRHAGP